MRNCKRILSSLLVAVMLLTALPFTGVELKASAITTTEVGNRIIEMAKKLGISNPNIYSGILIRQA